MSDLVSDYTNEREFPRQVLGPARARRIPKIANSRNRVSQAAWGAHLVRALKSGYLDQRGGDSVDEMLVWLRTFDSVQDELYKQCVREVGSPKAVRFEILRLLDASLLATPLDVRKVFGVKVISENDQDAIRSRHKRLTSVFHPDRGLADADWLNTRMVLINKAYSHALKLDKANNAKMRLYTDYIVRADTEAATYIKSEEVYSREEQQRDLAWITREAKLRSQLERLAATKVLRVALFGVIIVFGITGLNTINENFGGVTVASAEAAIAPIFVSGVGQVSDLADDLSVQTSSGIEPWEFNQTTVEPSANELSANELSANEPSINEAPINEAPINEAPINEAPINSQIAPIIDEYNQRQDQVRERASAADKQVNVSLLDSDRMLSESEINWRSGSIRKAGSSEAAIQPLVDPRAEGTVVADFGVAVPGVQSSSTVVRSSSVLVPQPIQTMLESLQTSFANSAAQKFGDHFVRNARYFNENGRTAIVGARKNFFEVIEAPELMFDIASYKNIAKDWYVLQGELKQSYMLRDHRELNYCERFNMLAGNTNEGVRIYSITRLDQLKVSCMIEPVAHVGDYDSKVVNAIAVTPVNPSDHG